MELHTKIHIEGHSLNANGTLKGARYLIMQMLRHSLLLMISLQDFIIYRSCNK